MLFSNTEQNKAHLMQPIHTADTWTNGGEFLVCTDIKYGFYTVHST